MLTAIKPISNQLPNDLERAFIFAGNAKVVFTSILTGASLTYRVRQAKDNDNLYFVSCFSQDEYKYIGIISANQFKVTGKTQIEGTSPKVQGFRYVFNKLMAGENTGVIISHAGDCGKCGRELTDPQSIETGFGPICHPRSTSKRKLKIVAVAPAPVENIINLDTCTDCNKAKPIYYTNKLKSGKVLCSICVDCFAQHEYFCGSSRG